MGDQPRSSFMGSPKNPAILNNIKRRSTFADLLLRHPFKKAPRAHGSTDLPILEMPDIGGRTISDISTELEKEVAWYPVTSAASPTLTPANLSTDKLYSGCVRAPSLIKEENEAESEMTPPVPPRSASRLSLATPLATPSIAIPTLAAGSVSRPSTPSYFPMVTSTSQESKVESSEQEDSTDDTKMSDAPPIRSDRAGPRRRVSFQQQDELPRKVHRKTVSEPNVSPTRTYQSSTAIDIKTGTPPVPLATSPEPVVPEIAADVDMALTRFPSLKRSEMLATTVEDGQKIESTSSAISRPLGVRSLKRPRSLASEPGRCRKGHTLPSSRSHSMMDLSTISKQMPYAVDIVDEGTLPVMSGGLSSAVNMRPTSTGSSADLLAPVSILKRGKSASRALAESSSHSPVASSPKNWYNTVTLPTSDSTSTRPFSYRQASATGSTHQLVTIPPPSTVEAPVAAEPASVPTDKAPEFSNIVSEDTMSKILIELRIMSQFAAIDRQTSQRTACMDTQRAETPRPSMPSSTTSTNASAPISETSSVPEPLTPPNISSAPPRKSLKHKQSQSADLAMRPWCSGFKRPKKNSSISMGHTATSSRSSVISFEEYEKLVDAEIAV